MYETPQHPVHVSIDLESLSLQPDAVVLSIGAAAFTLVGGVVKTFYAVLEQPTQIEHGRSISPSTVQWWEKQSREAQEAYVGPGKDTLTVLRQFADWFRSIPSLSGVWGFGSDFDNAMLQSLYREYGVPVPWPYRMNRCGRTITACLPQRRPPNTGTHHNALDDATYQAFTVRDSLMRLESLQRGVA